jgi:hypothetical protein
MPEGTAARPYSKRNVLPGLAWPSIKTIDDLKNNQIHLDHVHLTSHIPEEDGLSYVCPSFHNTKKIPSPFPPLGSGPTATMFAPKFPEGVC